MASSDAKLQALFEEIEEIRSVVRIYDQDDSAGFVEAATKLFNKTWRPLGFHEVKTRGRSLFNCFLLPSWHHKDDLHRARARYPATVQMKSATAAIWLRVVLEILEDEQQAESYSRPPRIVYSAPHAFIARDHIGSISLPSPNRMKSEHPSDTVDHVEETEENNDAKSESALRKTILDDIRDPAHPHIFAFNNLERREENTLHERLSAQERDMWRKMDQMKDQRLAELTAVNQADFDKKQAAGRREIDEELERLEAEENHEIIKECHDALEGAERQGA